VPATTRLPNFIYIGPDKAGSSWLHEALIAHPQVFMSPAKDLYFFDRYFDKGVDWYAGHFARSGDRPIVGEVCQDYLFEPTAAGRMASVLPEPRFMVNLRDPVDRALSSYLYMVRIGEHPGSFSEALATRPILLDHSRYGSALARFVEAFGRDRIYLGVFDDLVEDPQAFFSSLLEWLGVEPQELRPDLLGIRLPASKARSPVVARLVRDVADWVRRHDGAEAVGRIKRSQRVQRLLYVPLAQKPAVSDEDSEHIRSVLHDDIVAVEEMFGIELRRRWKWPEHP
jgi:hypothetical protein